MHASTLSRLSIVVAILVALTAGARAEHVDWSQYIDKTPPAPAKTVTPMPGARVQPVARPAKAAERPAKAVASKTRPRAKARRK